jgi:deoxyadenosine/deoxycytidine kinase
MNNQKKPKIAFCGAHGTGKTTLAKLLAQKYNLEVFGSLRTRWANFGVADFEKLPVEVRTIFQYKMLISHLQTEDELWNDGFVFDRSVLDYLAYTIISSDMTTDIKYIYSLLIKERLKRYDLLVFTPIEFAAENEELRANIESRDTINAILKTKLEAWLKPEDYLIVSGSIEDRVKQIEHALTDRGF